MESIKTFNSFRSFLITGATDGIGLLTATLLARNAPKNEPITIGIHGRNPKRIQNAIEKIKSEADKTKNNNITIKSFCYDLSDIK